MKNFELKKVLPVVALFILALAFPFLGFKAYYLHIAVISLIYIILAVGLNMVVGYVGQLSLAQAAFYGLGAYTSALLSVNFKLPFYITLPISTMVAAFFGFLLGAPTLRLRGPYFVVASIGFNEMVRLTFLNWKDLTNGPVGINNVAVPSAIKLGAINIDFSEKIHFYYLYLLIVIVVIVLIRNILDSRTGRAFKSIREDFIASEVMGVNLAFYKVFAFTLSAALAGLAGSMFVHYVGFVSPESFITAESINILIMVVIGGMGTITGPIIGAVSLSFMLENLRFLKEYRLIIYGFVLFVVIIFVPLGIMGLIDTIKEKYMARKTKLSNKGGRV